MSESLQSIERLNDIGTALSAESDPLIDALKIETGEVDPVSAVE